MKALGKVLSATKIYFDSSYFSDSLVASGLPDQTGNNGKFLSTDGTDAAWTTLAGGGDMLIATYDPTSVSGDAFDMDNMVDGTYVKTENNLTDALVTTIGTALQSETSHADVLVDGDIGVTVAAALGANDNYVTDAQLVVIGNTSGTNSGDNAANSSSTYIGTTQVALNRASAALTLAGLTLTTPNIGTPSAGVLTNCTGLTDAGLSNGKFCGGHIWGLVMSNAADTANDITVAVGEARNEANTGDLVLASAITKQLDAAWAVGTNAGGLNTGAKADSTWYEVILIKRVDTGVVDVMFSTTANRATLPANYTLSRRIGWVRTGAGGVGIKQFSQTEDYFTWITQVNDVATTKATAAAAVTLTVPPNTIARFRATADMSTSVNANSMIVFSEIVEGNVTPALSTGIGSLGYWDLGTGASAGHFELRVSSTSTIEHDSDVQVGNFDISTFGYIDRRCRLQNI